MACSLLRLSPFSRSSAPWTVSPLTLRIRSLLSRRLAAGEPACSDLMVMPGRPSSLQLAATRTAAHGHCQQPPRASAHAPAASTTSRASNQCTRFEPVVVVPKAQPRVLSQAVARWHAATPWHGNNESCRPGNRRQNRRWEAVGDKGNMAVSAAARGQSILEIMVHVLTGNGAHTTAHTRYSELQ